MDEFQLLDRYLLIGALLFGIGLVGFISRRNMIVMFLAAEMMLQGISVSLVAWGRFHNDWGGQVLVIFILTVAACEAGIALALILMLYHQSGKLDIAVWQTIREANQPKFVDRALPEETHDVAHWPKLPPAGVEPEQPLEELIHRSHV
jgi:NADH-quinone oxidoreductase subunit K